VTEDFTEKETQTMDYIQSVLKELGLTATLTLEREEGGMRININGDGLGSIIGRRGETLDALQYLASLVSNRRDGDYLRVTVDCGNYRGKRKETLEVLAKKLASQVLKTNVSKTLEPMNPFERRVIHATVSKIEGVTSSSVGEEPNRRVVITTPAARRPSPSRSGDRRPPRSYDGPREHTSHSNRDDAGHDAPRDHDRRPPRGGSRPHPERFDRGDRPERSERPERNDYPERRRPDAPRPAPTDAAVGAPPRQTPETELMAGASFGKLDLK
jgi:spoIIIJ-associated protein